MPRKVQGIDQENIILTVSENIQVPIDPQHKKSDKVNVIHEFLLDQTDKIMELCGITMDLRQTDKHKEQNYFTGCRSDRCKVQIKM